MGEEVSCKEDNNTSSVPPPLITNHGDEDW